MVRDFPTDPAVLSNMSGPEFFEMVARVVRTHVENGETLAREIQDRADCMSERAWARSYSDV